LRSARYAVLLWSNGVDLRSGFVVLLCGLGDVLWWRLWLDSLAAAAGALRNSWLCGSPAGNAQLSQQGRAAVKDVTGP